LLYKNIHTVKLRHSDVWSQYDFYVVGQQSTLCEVKWSRFVALSYTNNRKRLSVPCYF